MVVSATHNLYDLPKVSGLKRMFPDLYRNDPVLLKVSAWLQKFDARSDSVGCGSAPNFRVRT